jgi:hypothetical protein
MMARPERASIVTQSIATRMAPPGQVRDAKKSCQRPVQGSAVSQPCQAAEVGVAAPIDNNDFDKPRIYIGFQAIPSLLSEPLDNKSGASASGFA